MSPLNISTIDDKLFRLDENINFVDDILKKSDKEILKDLTIYYSLEHILQISIQIILDLSAHVLAEIYHENPSSYAEIIEALGKNKVIDGEFASSQLEMARFRNVLIHNYDSVDKEKVVKYAHQSSEIFRKFAKAFISISESEKKKHL